MKTTLIFVRHGEASGNVDRLFHGHYNSSLTENGHLQAKAAARYLKNYKIDIIYSSDLDRTCDTARYIANEHKLSINTRLDLREINGGDWENVAWDKLPLDFPESYENWLNHTHLLQMPNGESMIEFQQRLINAVDDITKDNIGKNICVVSHGTAIKSLLCYYYGFDLSAFTSLKWHDNTAISVVEYQNKSYNVILDGYDAHLGDLSTLAKQSWWKK